MILLFDCSAFATSYLGLVVYFSDSMLFMKKSIPFYILKIFNVKGTLFSNLDDIMKRNHDIINSGITR